MDLIDTSSRQLIPRWHTSRKLVELSRSSVRSFAEKDIIQPTDFRLEQSVQDWKSGKSLPRAIEVFAKLKLMNLTEDDLYKEVDSYLKSYEDSLSPAVTNLVFPRNKSIDTSALYCTDNAEIYKIIAKLKMRVSMYPNDALTWNDLGFYYAVLGQFKPAEHCMLIAFESSNRAPMIARAYSRLLLESNNADPEHAIAILQKSKKLLAHPSLISAELAIRLHHDIGKPNLSYARKIVDRFSSRPDLITELSASIATEEIRNGAVRNARKKLAVAAISPTENTISQLHWIQARQKIDLTKLLEGLQSSVESKVFDLYKAERFVDCRDQLMILHDFQPFTADAIVHAGYISLSSIDDPSFVINTYERYKSITSKSVIAKNNLAVALIEKGDLHAAEQIILDNVNASTDDQERFMSKATTALLLYRTGEIKKGRQLYEQAVQQFRHHRQYSQLANVLFYFGREELQHDVEHGLKLVEESKEIIEDKEVSMTLKVRANELIENHSKTVKS